MNKRDILDLIKQFDFKIIVIVSIFLLSNLYICHFISPSKSVLLIGIIFQVALLCLYISTKLLVGKKILNIYQVFLVFLLFEGFLYLFIFLPITVPDELYHFTHTYNYSNLLLFLPFDSDLLIMRQDDIDYFDNYGNAMTLDYYKYTLSYSSLFAIEPSVWESSFSGITDLGANPPQVRIPAALGIALGRLLNLGPVVLFYLGRVFNFIYFAILVYIAVRITPIGKTIFMMVCLLPMTLHLAGSYSYDAGSIGLSFVFIALIFKAVYSKAILSKKLICAICIVAFLLAPCKVVYSCTVLLVFLIPSKCFRSKKYALIFRIALLALTVFSIVIWRLPSLINLSGVYEVSAADNNTSGAASGTYTIYDLIKDPIGFVQILCQTFHQYGDFYIKTLIGGSLGWFQAGIEANWYVVIAFIILLILAILCKSIKEPRISSKQRWSYIAVFVLASLFIILALCLDWTPKDSAIIEGVQGRYFLPVLPLLLLGLRGNIITSSKDYSLTLIYATAVFNVAYITKIFAQTLTI